MELASEKYYDAPAIQSRYIYMLCMYKSMRRNVLLLGLYRQEMIEGKWNDLLASLEACKNTLSRYHDLMSVFSEMNDCLANMAQIEVSQREAYSPTYFPLFQYPSSFVPSPPLSGISEIRGLWQASSWGTGSATETLTD